MPLKSIIVDNQTKAQRIAPDKVQLELVAFPLNENNDTEPDIELRLYINGEIFQNLKSDIDGSLKQSIVIDGTNQEQILIKLEDLEKSVQSRIRSVMIEPNGKEPKETDKNETKKDKKEIIDQEKEEREEIIRFVKKRGWNLSDERCKKYINDPIIVMEAVKNDGIALQFASENLRNNYEIALNAVGKNGLALEFVSNALKQKEEIYTTAMDQDIRAYNFMIGFDRKEGKVLEKIFNAICKDSSLLSKINLDEQDRKIFTNNGDSQLLFNTKYGFIKNNKDIYLKIIKNTRRHDESEIYNHMPEKIKNDKGTINEIVDIILNKQMLLIRKQHAIINIITRLGNNNPPERMKILEILEKVKKGELISIYNNIINNLGIIGKTLINEQGFVERIFDEYFKNEKENGNEIELKKYCIISSLIAIPTCRLTKDKEFILRQIKNSKKQNEQNMTDEAYLIFQILIDYQSQLIHDQYFVSEAFKYLNVSNKKSLKDRYHIFSTYE